MKSPIALVLGGTGAIGSEVLRLLAKSKVPTVFTWHRAKERALALAAELGQRAIQVDLADLPGTRTALRALQAEGFRPNVLIHCAGTSRQASFRELTDDA